MDIDGGVAGGPHIVLGQENAHSNDEARSHDRGLDHRTCLDSHNLLPHPGDAPPTSQARVVWSRISVLASWPSSHYISNRPNESRLSHPSIPSVLWREGNASQLAEAATPGPRPVPGNATPTGSTIFGAEERPHLARLAPEVLRFPRGGRVFFNNTATP